LYCCEAIGGGGLTSGGWRSDGGGGGGYRGAILMLLLLASADVIHFRRYKQQNLVLKQLALFKAGRRVHDS
jgi:hypothetical protein